MLMPSMRMHLNHVTCKKTLLALTRTSWRSKLISPENLSLSSRARVSLIWQKYKGRSSWNSYLECTKHNTSGAFWNRNRINRTRVNLTSSRNSLMHFPLSSFNSFLALSMCAYILALRDAFLRIANSSLMFESPILNDDCSRRRSAILKINDGKVKNEMSALQLHLDREINH